MEQRVLKKLPRTIRELSLNPTVVGMGVKIHGRSIRCKKSTDQSMNRKDTNHYEVDLKYIGQYNYYGGVVAYMDEFGEFQAVPVKIIAVEKKERGEYYIDTKSMFEQVTRALERSGYIRNESMFVPLEEDSWSYIINQVVNPISVEERRKSMRRLYEKHSVEKRYDLPESIEERFVLTPWEEQRIEYTIKHIGEYNMNGPFVVAYVSDALAMVAIKSEGLEEKLIEAGFEKNSGVYVPYSTIGTNINPRCMFPKRFILEYERQMEEKRIIKRLYEARERAGIVVDE